MITPSYSPSESKVVRSTVSSFADGVRVAEVRPRTSFHVVPSDACTSTVMSLALIFVAVTAASLWRVEDPAMAVG